MSSHIFKAATAALPLAFLVACSSGGGGGPTGTTTFTDFNNLNPDGTTVLQGKAITASFTANTSGPGLTYSNESGPNEATARIYSENGTPIGVSVSAPGSSVNVDQRDGGAFTSANGFVSGVSGSGSQTTLFADPSAMGFKHQTFGAWVNGDPSAAGSFGVGSFGNRTGHAPAQTATTATYTGKSVGILSARDNALSGTVKADATVSTDFHSVSFQTKNSTLSTFDGSRVNQSVSGLDLTGSGTVANGGFTGTAASRVVRGSVSGDFYGPNADEIGGTFSTVDRNGRYNYIGSYGAKR